MGYELDVDQALLAITALFIEETNKTTKHFGTYDVVKSREVTDLKTANAVKRKDKIVKKFKKKFRVEIGEIGTKKEA